MARLCKAVLGKKQAKTVSLQSFRPTIDVVWERGELQRVVKEFENFLDGQWEDDKYFKIE